MAGEEGPDPRDREGGPSAERGAGPGAEREEGAGAGGSAAEVDERLRRRHGTAVLALVGALVVGAVLAGVALGFRATGLVLGCGLVAVAGVRLLGSTRLAGPLAVRSRSVDAAVALVLAAALVGLSLTTPGGGPRPGGAPLELPGPPGVPTEAP